MIQPKPEGILYRTEYFDAVGDVVAALVMSQVHYWYSPSKTGKSKLRVHRDGKWWVAKSLQEWAAECHLSLMQVRRSIGILESKGLLEVQSFMLGRHQVTHLRMPFVKGRGPIFDVPEFVKTLVIEKGTLVTGNTDLVTGNIALVTGNIAGVTDNKSITVDYTETTQKLLQGGDATALTPITDIPEENPMIHGKAIDGCKAILAKLKSKGKPIEEYPVSPQGLYLLWVNVVPDYHEGVGCQKPWTMAQKAQANKLISLWGPEHSREIMEHVIKDWVGFVKYCEDHSGAFKTPLLPTFQFLNKYGAEAKNYWLAAPKALPTIVKKGNLVFKKLSAPPPETVQLTAQPPKVEDEDKPMTLEELLKWKADKSK